MRYRKHPSQTRKLLLRVAAPAGVAAMVGTAAACSSSGSSTSQFVGAVAMPTDAASDAADDFTASGFVLTPPDGGDQDVTVGIVGGGVVAMPQDGGLEASFDDVFNGVMVSPRDP